VTVEWFVRGGPRVAALAEVVPALHVEEEFLLLRPDGDAACVAPGVLGAVAHDLRVQAESTPFQVGSTTRICTDLSAVAGELSIARRALAEAAADHGARLVALGTPPFAAPGPAAVGDEPRPPRAAGVPGVIGVTGATCAFQVHVQVPSRELGAAVLDRCRGWLPTLLALTGNSPLWRGHDTGWSSYRFVVRRRRPAFVPPPRCADEAAADQVVAGLVGSRAALDARTAHSWARLTPDRPAVEFRIPDTCSTVADAVLIAGLCRGLTAVALAQERAGRPAPDVPRPVVAASAWAAARWGLGAFVVDPLRGGSAPAGVVLAGLVSTVAPALEAAGDLPMVTALLQERLRRGSGADRQRALRRRCDRPALVQTLANICAGVDRRD
jgi:carboxylate-amine ligase